jgi:hypothetical protein
LPLKYLFFGPGYWVAAALVIDSDAIAAADTSETLFLKALAPLPPPVRRRADS